ncbi:MAG: flippase-like domain-containing protein [Sulfolobales archaeon]|nr:flippase-like domain-containing protein [Sulfolobales archaeon]
MASKKAILIASITTAVIYATVIYLALNLNLNDISPMLSVSNLNYLIPVFFFRISALLLHSLSWYFILKVFRSDISIIKTIAITLVAIFTEVIIPIGGITEIAKILLASQVLGVPQDGALSALLMHRLLLTIITAIFTVIAVDVVEAPIGTSLTILLPTLGLLVLNLSMLLLPSSQIFRKATEKLTSRLNIPIQDFSKKYRESTSKLFSEGGIAITLTSLTIIAEKLVNAVYGVCLCRLMSTDINIFASLIVFDSIYVIMWLLPVVTPGNLGVFETVQIMIFKLLGTSLKSAALIALLNRAIILITELPLMLLSTTYLGIRAKHLIKTVLNKEKPRN